jgi:hypothetical protein
VLDQVEQLLPLLPDQRLAEQRADPAHVGPQRRVVSGAVAEVHEVVPRGRQPCGLRRALDVDPHADQCPRHLRTPVIRSGVDGYE